MEKERRTLIASSVERENKLQHEFETATPLRIYPSCRRKYTRKDSILCDSRKVVHEEEKAFDTHILRSSNSQKFAIKIHCLFYGDLIHTNSKTPYYRRRAISLMLKL